MLAVRCTYPNDRNSVSLQSGFTLIELMVSMLILSVALLAMAGLQASSLINTHKAYMRTQAGIAAMEMAERMRVNLVGVNANEYASVSNPPASKEPTSCQSNNCSAENVAAEDGFQWLSSLAENRDLVSAQGRVTCEDSNEGDGDLCTDGSIHTITVMWDGRRNGATGTGCSGSAADLTCHQIRIRP